MTDYSNKTRVLPGSAFHTYSDEEVVWIHDADHTPFRNRKDADLKVEVRAPIFQGAVNFVNLLATETTKIKGGQERSQIISITVPVEEFDKIVAHVNRAKPNPLLEELKKWEAYGAANGGEKNYSFLASTRAAIAAVEGGAK